MKKNLFLAVFVFLIGSSLLYASKRQDRPEQYQQGTILKIEKKVMKSPNECCYNPADAPLQSEHYAFDISVHVGCSTYVARYENSLGDLPPVISPDRTIPVRVTKHDLYFDVREGHEMRMSIVHRSTGKGAGCDTGAAAHQS